MIAKLKQLYRQNQEKRRNQAIDAYYQQGATTAYQSLIRQLPDHTLSPNQEKEIETYAADVLGNASFSAWLKVFTACRGEFLEGWMPLDYLARIVYPRLNGALQPLGKIKTMTQKFLNNGALPDLAYCINGSWLLATGEKTSPQALKNILFEAYPFVFLKQDHTSRGGGVIKVDAETFSTLDFNQLGNFVIQAPIMPHKLIRELSPAAVPSLRVTTYKPAQQSAKVMQSAIRLGLEGVPYIYEDHCIRIGIRIQDGCTHDFGFVGNWEIVNEHTDTRISIKNRQIPKYDYPLLCQ